MGWAPLAANVPLDAPQSAPAAPPASPAPTDAQTPPATPSAAPTGFVPLPADAQLDQSASAQPADTATQSLSGDAPITITAPRLQMGDGHVFDRNGNVILEDKGNGLIAGADTGIIGENGGTHTENDPKMAGANDAVEAMLKSGASNGKIIDYLKARGASDRYLMGVMPQLLKIRQFQAQNPQYKGGYQVDLERKTAANSIGQDLSNSDVGAVPLHFADAATAFNLARLSPGNTEQNQQALDENYSAHPISSTIGTLGGGAATAALAEAASTAGLTAAGLSPEAASVVAPVASDIGYGGASGFSATNTGENGAPATIGERLRGGLEGAAAVLGGRLATEVTLAGAMHAPLDAANAGKSVLGSSPNLARRIVTKAIAEDGNTPESAAQMIAEARANGVPMALGDTGENVRGLLAASTRASGVGRTIARDALEERQGGLGDRITGAIERDLGPVANPHQVADDLMTKARDNAAPIYEQAYSRPGAQTFGARVSPLLQRPSMKKAIGNAYRIAAEEGRDPETLGFEHDLQTGETTLTKVPSWQTLDYVKRGLDDVLEGYRDPTTGKLNLDTEGRAINNTRTSFVNAFDKANPAYAEARQAWGGPVSAIDAMNLGRKALNMTADDLEARIRELTPANKQMFALGVRRAMAEMVQSKGDTADVVNALVGTGKKRAMLARVFGDRKQFQRFVNTLGQEREGYRTFKQGLLGSPTAANEMDDAHLEAASMAADFAMGHMAPITAATKAVKFFQGKVGKKAQEHIAALLSNTDPAAIGELAAHLRNERIRRGLVSQRINNVASTAGKLSGGAAGAAWASQ